MSLQVLDKIGETISPHLQSWVELANDEHADFPIQTRPYGVFRRKGGVKNYGVEVAICDMIFDISALANTVLRFDEAPRSGRDPITLDNGETRTSLDDGDEVIFRKRCSKYGYRAIGFGICAGTIAQNSGT